MVGNKKVSCKICSEVISFSEDPKQRCKDIDSCTDEASIYSEKRTDPHSDGLDELPLSGDEIEEKKLEKIIVQDDYEYTKKLKLGKKIYEIINNCQVHQQSLRSEYKEALELYMKKSVKLLPQSKQS